MESKMAIFGKKDDNGRARYWVSITTLVKKGDDEEKISASMPVSLSRKAEEVFMDCCEVTKNKNIAQMYAEVTDCWHKAAKGKTKDGDDRTFVYLFINGMQKAEAKKEAKAKW